MQHHIQIYNKLKFYNIIIEIIKLGTKKVNQKLKQLLSSKKYIYESCIKYQRHGIVFLTVSIFLFS